MKKTLFTIALASLFIACEGTNKEESENPEETTLTENSEETPVDLSELREFPLADYDLDAVLFIPKNHFMIS